MNNASASAAIFGAPVNPLFLQSALCALSHKQLLRITDTPAFASWPETSKSLLLEEIRTRSQEPRGHLPPADPLAA